MLKKKNPHKAGFVKNKNPALANMGFLLSVSYVVA